MREQEPQRRDDAVHRRRRYARLVLLELELPDILGGRGMGRAPQPGREPPDVAQIVTLRLARQPAHGHVVAQPLAQSADRAHLDKLIHRSPSTSKVSTTPPTCQPRSNNTGP